MDAKKIPITRITRGGATGTPDEFDNHFTRQRRKGSGLPTTQPKLRPLENLSLKERMSKVGIEEV